MRILFSANPTWGHLLALRPLADAAHTLGHDVAFVAGEQFASVVAPHRLLAAGPDLNTMLDATAEKLGGGRDRQPGPAVVETMAGTRIELTYEEALTAASGFQPDVLVCGSQDYVGSMLAAALARPWVEFAMTAPPPADFVSALEKRAAREFERRGLRASPRAWLLDPVPATLRAEDEPFASDRLGIQPVPLGGEKLNPATRRPEQWPATALLTLGSLAEPEALAAMAGSLSAAGVAVLVTATADEVTDDFPDDGCELVGFVPFATLLPRVDPVENAALMPWLIATAYIHSVMIQEKRGMLKVWNVSLVMLAGVMAMVGDFLVRSGVLSSIHAFVPDPTLDIAFVAIVSVMVIGSVGLVLWRREALRSSAAIDSVFSREAAFVAQNMVLVALTMVIFWVTFFPLISQALTGNEIDVGQAAFLPFIDPLAIAVVALAGIGPIIPWRRMTPGKLRHSFTFPLAAGLTALVALLFVPGVAGHWPSLGMFCAAAFLVATVVQEFWRGTRARARMTHEAPPVAVVQLVRRNRRRYGGYIVHFGVAIALVGIAASTTFQHQRRAVLMPGHSVRSDGYTFTYVRPVAEASAQDLGFGAVIRVTKGARHVTTVETMGHLYPSSTSSQPVGRFFDTGLGASAESRVGLDAGLLRDIWVVIAPDTSPLNGLINQGDAKFDRALTQIGKLPVAQQQRDATLLYDLRDQLVSALTDRWVTHPWPAQFLIEVSPLVTWLWLGGIIAALGGLTALWPAPRRRRGGRSDGPAGTRAGRRRAPAGVEDGASVGAPQPARAGELVTRMERTWPAT